MCSPDSRYFLKQVIANAFTFNGGGLEIRNYRLLHNDDLSISFANLKNGGSYHLLITKTTALDKNLSVNGAIILGINATSTLLSGASGTKFLFEIFSDGSGIYLSRQQTVNDNTSGFAPLYSPGFTGVPTAPTASVSTNNTQLATTAFVKSVVAALVNSSPAALDTLSELAAALGNDPAFSTTVLNSLATKLDKTLSVQTKNSLVVSYTLAPSDNATLIRFEANSAINITLPNSLTEGFNVGICQEGTGQITFNAESGATLNNYNGQNKTAGQYAIVCLIVKKNAGGLAAIYNLDGTTG